MACSGEAALDFVVDEDGAYFVAAVSEGLEEGGRGNVNTAFALDGFDYHAARLFCNQSFDSCFVIVGPVLEAGYHRRERFLVLRVWGRR